MTETAEHDHEPIADAGADHTVADNGERVPRDDDDVTDAERTAAVLRDPDAPGNHVDDESGPLPEPNEPG